MAEAEASSLFEYVTLAGVFVGGILAALVGYRRRPERPAAEVAVASVGLELGNKLQMDDLIKAVNRLGDILENKKQAGMEKKLDELLERMEEIEEDHEKDQRRW